MASPEIVGEVFDELYDSVEFSVRCTIVLPGFGEDCTGIREDLFFSLLDLRENGANGGPTRICVQDESAFLLRVGEDRGSSQRVFELVKRLLASW